MEIKPRMIGDVTILDCSGKITLIPGDPVNSGVCILRRAVRAELERGTKKIILNLAEVNYIDSSAIGELVSSHTTITNQAGQLKLLNLTQKIQELLQITRLLTVFSVCDNEAMALASFETSQQEVRS